MKLTFTDVALLLLGPQQEKSLLSLELADGDWLFSQVLRYLSSMGGPKG